MQTGDTLIYKNRQSLIFQIRQRARQGCMLYLSDFEFLDVILPDTKTGADFGDPCAAKMFFGKTEA
ncbi:hypothetical protein N7457_004588 [Penicillium paradoxum]|uniref:uncharacterized protein n=1 Tax=Penicillium paradoxum TaxID=176176 RepID=UPI0025473756|nr:uncharacterized protein N7457_004588 [Penicillium paradoxum]KAJ5782814.1 hypothetical protein N7457_004588 [Penicillium paradoxum]